MNGVNPCPIVDFSHRPHSGRTEPEGGECSRASRRTQCGSQSTNRRQLFRVGLSSHDGCVVSMRYQEDLRLYPCIIHSWLTRGYWKAVVFFTGGFLFGFVRENIVALMPSLYTYPNHPLYIGAAPLMMGFGLDRVRSATTLMSWMRMSTRL